MNANRYLTSIDGNAEIQKAKERLFHLAPDFVHAIVRDADELTALREANAELVKALEEISATADEELGDWSSVMPAHIPDGLTFAWNIRAAADLAISKHKKG